MCKGEQTKTPCSLKFKKTPGLDGIEQGSPIGGGGGTPYPPGEGQKNLQNWLNQGFFQIFFVNLIQNGLNDTKMEFFSM